MLKLSINTKFILWFLFIALVPLAIATYVSYNSSREVLEKEITNSLLAVAENKANQIESYLNEKEKNVTTFSYTSEVIDIIEKFRGSINSGGIGSPEYVAVEKEFRPFLEYYQRLFGYDDLFLILSNGNIIFSVKQRQDPRSLYEIALSGDSELARVFIKVKESSKTEISDFEYYPETQKGAVFIAAPVFERTDLLGFVALQMGTEGICEFVQDYTGLGQTGETIVIAKIKDEAVFLTPLRTSPDATFKTKIAVGSKEGLDIQKAVGGEEGSGVTLDYQGKEVLSVWKYLPSFRLGMIVKMETSEVFSSANQLRNTLSMISSALLVMVVIMAVAIAHSVAGPIKELTKISSIITEGNLSSRASINTNDEIGELARSFNQMTDSLVEAKARVEEQKKLLEKANKELDSFVYTASHDLRAPLRGIASFAGFLDEDYKDKLDKEGQDHLKEIRDGTKRMNELIEDLLKLSRISRIKNPYEDVDISELINSVIKRIEFDVKEKKVDLKIQDKLPVVKCDRIKIAEVFLNLVNNAIKFSSKNNKKSPKVEVGYMEEDKFHKFYVKDNGIGIDPKHHQQVFDIFKRLHTADEYEGTGAGLSIVKKVIDDHGGNIWIESELGKGATFYFTIPKDLREKKENSVETSQV